MGRGPQLAGGGEGWEAAVPPRSPTFAAIMPLSCGYRAAIVGRGFPPWDVYVVFLLFLGFPLGGNCDLFLEVLCFFGGCPWKVTVLCFCWFCASFGGALVSKTCFEGYSN